MSAPLKKRPKRLAGFLAGTVLICAVKSVSIEKPTPQKVVITSETDGGKQLALLKGGVLEVRLGVSPGTGFSWHITQCDRNRLKPLGAPAFQPPAKGKPGSSEQQVFRFKALATGRVVLKLAYRRAWEKDRSAARTFKTTVKIQ